MLRPWSRALLTVSGLHLQAKRHTHTQTQPLLLLPPPTPSGYSHDSEEGEFFPQGAYPEMAGLLGSYVGGGLLGGQVLDHGRALRCTNQLRHLQPIGKSDPAA